MSDVKSPTAITVGGFFGLLFLIVIWAIWLSTENRRTVQEHGKMPKVVFKGAARAGRRVRGGRGGAAEGRTWRCDKAGDGGIGGTACRGVVADEDVVRP